MIESARSREPPNIVVLISHDLGCHIGPYGRAGGQTTHLLRFAAEASIAGVLILSTTRDYRHEARSRSGVR